MRGIQHTIEPEADSLSFIDFENELAGMFDQRDRYQWNRKAVRDVVYEVLGGPANIGGDGERIIAVTTDALVLSHTGPEDLFDLDETGLWEAVARWANAKGFDTYNSDSRFELFPGGTPAYQEVEG